MAKKRVLICGICEGLCSPSRDDEIYESDCCAGAIFPSFPIEQSELAEIAAAQSEEHSENEAREEAK